MFATEDASQWTSFHCTANRARALGLPALASSISFSLRDQAIFSLRAEGNQKIDDCCSVSQVIGGHWQRGQRLLLIFCGMPFSTPPYRQHRLRRDYCSCHGILFASRICRLLLSCLRMCPTEGQQQTGRQAISHQSSDSKKEGKRWVRFFFEYFRALLFLQFGRSSAFCTLCSLPWFSSVIVGYPRRYCFVEQNKRKRQQSSRKNNWSVNVDEMVQIFAAHWAAEEELKE